MESVKNCQDFPVVFFWSLLRCSLVQDLMILVNDQYRFHKHPVFIASLKTGRKSQHFFTWVKDLHLDPSKNFDPSPQPTGLKSGASIPRPFSYT
jgi:hypothetical protein